MSTDFSVLQPNSKFQVSQVPKSIHKSRDGLSLVEMMIALTMTLIVLGAMMAAFKFASAEMKNGRSILELAAQLRLAETLMRADLENATVEPLIHYAQIPNGCFEYIEGPGRGSRGFYGIDLNNNGIADTVEAVTTGGADLNANGIDDTFENQNYLGDLDDCLVLTARSPKDPYRGKITFNTLYDAASSSGPFVTSDASDSPTVIESPLAEIVWTTEFTDRTTGPGTFGNLAVDFDESVRVYRRVRLIMPNLNSSSALPRFAYTAATSDAAYLRALEYLAVNDISARIETITIGGTAFYQIVANSLEDLSLRQNRTARVNASVSPFGALPYPHPLNRAVVFTTRSSDYVFVGPTTAAFVDLDGFTSRDGNMHALRPNNADLVLSDVCEFDIKVFAPNAVVQQVAAAPPTATQVAPETTLLEPHNDGFVVAGVPTGAISDLNGGVLLTPNGDVAGTAGDLTDLVPTGRLSGVGAVFQNHINGAFVDLGHRGTAPASTGVAKAHFGSRIAVNSGYAILAPPAGVFTSPAPSLAQDLKFNLKNRFDKSSIDYQYRFELSPGTTGTTIDLYHTLLETVWDQWSPAYENDGFDQDGDGIVDEGTNGIDDDGNYPPTAAGVANNWNNGTNGIADDVTERETSAPYPHPLRGIKVTFRVVEKGTKQVRQTSVKHSFVPQ